MSATADPAAEATRPERRDYVTIFLLSCSILTFQIALTRVLSVVVWYHFAFLTISMVMLGLGAPGVWFALMKRPLRWLQPCLIASGVTVPLSMVLIIKNASTFLQDGATVWVILCVLPAMLALGSVICLLLMKATGEHIQRMYGVDLIGACLGAVIIIPLLHVVPTPELAASCGLLPLLAALQYGGRWRLIGGALAVAVVAMMATTSLLKVTHSKNYDETEHAPVFEKWTPTARLTVFDEGFFVFEKGNDTGFSWGRGSEYPDDAEPVRQYWLEQDGSAGTPITQFDGDVGALGHLDYDITTVGYQLRPPKQVTIIGGGGGRDILSALRAGAEHVDVVELNRHTVEAVSETFAHISGDVYHHPKVTAHVDEGRSYLTHHEAQNDLIQISLIDSFAASTAGAFALAENNLYTREAYQLYFDRLSERGLLSTSRWLTEMPRLLILARAALEQAGFEDPARHVLIASAGQVCTVLISRTAFDQQDVAKLREICAARGFVIQHPRQPDQPSDPNATKLVNGQTGFLSALGFNVSPPTDDSPYFFHMLSPFADSAMFALDAHEVTGLDLNLGSTLVLRRVIVLVSVLALVLFLAPFVRHALRRRGEAGANATPWSVLLQSTLFFAAIGAGFMLLENMLLQHFVLYLGHPSYATTVIISSLLLGMGVGSMRAGRLGVRGLARLGWIAPVAILVAVTLLPTLFTATLGLPLGARIAITCAVLLPLGCALGMFFPLGMLRFGDGNKPWFWAINGVFGVVASVMSLALSMDFGFLFVGQLSAGIYLLAWLCLLGARRPA